MMRYLLIALLAAGLVAGTASAQTATTGAQPEATRDGTSGGGTTPGPNSGAYDRLSPGNQKIARAIYDSYKATSGEGGGSTSLTLDDIAAMKQDGRGWGEIFKDLKGQGLIQEKNLGQVISRYQHQQKGLASGRTPPADGSTAGVFARAGGKGHGGYRSTGPVVTSGSGRTTVEAPRGHGKSFEEGVPGSGGAATVTGSEGPGRGHGGGASMSAVQGGGHGQGAGVTSGRGAGGGYGRGKH